MTTTLFELIRDLQQLVGENPERANWPVYVEHSEGFEIVTGAVADLSDNSIIVTVDNRP